MWNPFTRTKRKSNERDIDAGEYLYYIIEEGTNIRMMHEGEPIIFSSKESAKLSCEDVYDIPIRIASYNREYGEFTNIE